MNRLRLLLVCVVLLGGCQPELKTYPPLKAPPPAKTTVIVDGREFPMVNVPLSLRQSNWLGPNREGSCVHASMVSLLRWQGKYALADWWKRNNGDGEWDEDLAAKLTKAGVKFAYTSKKADVKFLEWACSTRRGCAVTVMGGRHMVCLVHFDKEWAGILDNNSTDKIIWVPRKTFVAEWINSTSWAVTPVYTPAPPLPPAKKLPRL